MKRKAKKIHRSLGEIEADTKKVRQAIVDKSSTHRITAFVVKRCQAERPDSWYLAAVTQLANILKVGPHLDIRTARALVSEFTIDPLIVSEITRDYSWLWYLVNENEKVDDKPES